MISRNYVVRVFREHLALFVVSFNFLGIFQFLVVMIIIKGDFLGFAQQLYRQLPAAAQQLFGQEFLAQFSIQGAMGFAYYHPLVLVLFALVAILLPARHIAGEVEQGTLELLLALPVKRLTLGVSLWVMTGVALSILLVGCWLGTAIGMWVYPGARVVAAANIAKLGTNLWLLMFAISSYTFLFSSFAREGGKAILRAAGLTLVFYLLNFAVKIWPTISFLQALTLFHYYQPQKLMLSPSIWAKNLVVLALVSLGCGLFALRQLKQRDIPG